MIINHEKKIIFIKTKKTAGTSLEIALSKYCGANCVIAPIAPVDEKKEQSSVTELLKIFLIPIGRQRRRNLLVGLLRTHLQL